MPAANEKISFRLAARFMALLLLLAATAASAQARSAAENRVWRKSAPTTQSLLSQPLQLLELHQVKAPVQLYDTSGYTFAAESAGASSTLTNFSGKVGQATDGVLGGFVKADGTVDFVPFTSKGLTGHTAAQAAGAIPADAAGGFSVTVQDGKVVGYNFQSALNLKSDPLNGTLSPALQQQIKGALSTVTAGH